MNRYKFHVSVRPRHPVLNPTDPIHPDSYTACITAPDWLTAQRGLLEQVWRNGDLVNWIERVTWKRLEERNQS